MTSIDATHDPTLRSWVQSANDSATDFPIQNLPFGVFAREGSNEPPRVGIAIGDSILDVSVAASAGLLDAASAMAGEACAHPSLNALLALGPEHWASLRRRVSDLLRDGSDVARAAAARASELLTPMAGARLLLPADVGDYTDFYASIFHATNVGSLLRPDNPLLPNYKHVPIGYHGRASSIVPSGTPIRRPAGQTRPENGPLTFGPTRALDYEMEMAVVVGPGNALGEPIPIDEAEGHVFGLSLLNDWSARDIQGWEYQPLGPFLSKSFATTLGPWVVTLDALAPFRSPAFVRADGDPGPLPYLDSPIDREAGGIDVTVEVLLRTDAMRVQGIPAVRVSTGRFADMYWTVAQLIAHHSSNGCNLRPGDLLGSGTISGSSKGSLGCLLEITRRGAEPLVLPNGEERRFLQDGDEVIMRAACERPGARRIGFGECRGIIAGSPSRPSST